jgi:hypothetical protein
MRAVIALLALVPPSRRPPPHRPYSVPIDQAGLLRLPEEASAIVVGNPAIADATMFDARTVFISGRALWPDQYDRAQRPWPVIYANDVSVTQSAREHVQVYHNQKQHELRLQSGVPPSAADRRSRQPVHPVAQPAQRRSRSGRQRHPARPDRQ